MRSTHQEPTPADPTRRRQAEILWCELAERFDVSRLRRLRAMLETWSGQRPAVCYAEQSAYGWGDRISPMFFMPDLPDDPWPDPSGFPVAAALVDAFPDIRREAARLLDGSLKPPPYGLRSDAAGDAQPLSDAPAGWREWRLMQDGRRIESRCAPFPVTSGLLDRVQGDSEIAAHVAFLAMRPGTELERHVDWSNWWVALWLCLEAPADCAIEVAGTTRELRTGDCFSFCTGYFHRSWNHGAATRLVLSLFLLHPDLTAEERRAIFYLRGRFEPEANFIPVI